MCINDGISQHAIKLGHNTIGILRHLVGLHGLQKALLDEIGRPFRVAGMSASKSDEGIKVLQQGPRDMAAVRINEPATAFH